MGLYFLSPAAISRLKANGGLRLDEVARRDLMGTIPQARTRRSDALQVTRGRLRLANESPALSLLGVD